MPTTISKAETGTVPKEDHSIPYEENGGLSGNGSPSANGGSAEARHALQRHSSSALRRHGIREAVRIGTLVAGDVFGLFLGWMVLEGLRSTTTSASSVGRFVSEVLPDGFIQGWPFAVALFFGLVVTRSYERAERWRDAKRVLSAVFLAAAMVFWQPLWNDPYSWIPLQLLAVVSGVGAVLILIRKTFEQIVHHMRMKREMGARTLVVGPLSALGNGKVGEFFERGSAFRQVASLVSTEPEDGVIRDALLVPRLAEVVAERDIETILLCGTLAEEVFEDVLEVTLTSGCELVSFSRAAAGSGATPSFSLYHGIPITELTRPSLKAHQLVLKRTLDLTVAGMLLILGAPLFALIALAVKLSSKGPVFFRQERVGLGGRRFEILKFRSMREDAEERMEELRHRSIYADGRLFKVEKDPRVTPVGRWLRLTSLDELPQLVNVFRGEMSLVGPRPPLPREVELYEAHHYCRFDVKPGITGPWQVNGRNGVTDFEKVVRMEREYIQGWSLLTDMGILLATVPALLRGNGRGTVWS